MQFRYTKHIKKRIFQRELTAEQIEDAVTNPDRTQPSFGERYLAQKSFHARIPDVVYKRESQNIILITTYWLREGK